MANHNIGSISSATTRPEDLIPSLLWELQHQKPCHREHRKLCTAIAARMATADYFDGDDASEDLQELFDALDQYSPEGFYFGASDGDGCSYGWWLSASFTEEFDGLRVDDLSEIPRDYFGSILLVNDHGNTSLYTRARNYRLTEQWSIV
jgi:hypothetical protein